MVFVRVLPNMHGRHLQSTFCVDLRLPAKTGAEVGDGDGGRPGYHSPAGDTYVPNCDVQTLREYWRIFEQADGSAYMIPRPDGLGLAYE